MAREQRRLLIAPQRLAAAAAGVLALSAEESRYLTRVLRYGPGDGFAVLDGAGGLWSAELLGPDQARLLQQLQRDPAPRPQLVLAAAVVKRDFEVVVRMAVELGVDRLLPLLCERTAVQGQPRPERWRSIAAEAAEQCERLWLPSIEDPLPVTALLQQYPASPERLCFWATTRQQALPDLSAALESEAGTGTGTEAAIAEMVLACGPEGGWSGAEEEQAAAAGWRPVQLGPRILRSSTACVAALSGLSAWRARRHGC